MKRVSIFLVMVALIVGMIGCNGESYALAIVSTTGGNVTVPGEGMFTYDEGTVVNLTAEAQEGYCFVNWTGNVSSIVDVDDATTTITMNASYFITANFEEILSVHYDLTVYSTEGGSVTIPGEGVFTFAEGVVVTLVAEVEEGYHFGTWTGDVGTVADVNAATTTIAMNGDYSITASFIPDGAELIWDWYDLDDIRNDLDGYYILMNDLDSDTHGYEELASPAANGGQGWNPIGTYDDRLTGTFDGRGLEICDLYIYRSAENVGLFGFIAGSGFIQDVSVLNVAVTGYRYVGSLVGRNDGTVINCHASGRAAGDQYIGGLMGWNYHNASGCSAICNVTGYSGSYYIGGLVGRNDGSLTNCHAISSIIGWDGGTGGLVAENLHGTISNCYAIGNVTGECNVGGLVGTNHDSTISDCYATGSVTGGDRAGGLAGVSSAFSTISNCYAQGSVTGDSDIGGLVGTNDESTVISCYATCSVAGGDSVGGLVGVSKSTSIISDCYAAGSVTGAQQVAGLVGSNSWSNVNDCYAIGSVTGDYDVGGLVGFNEYGTVTDSFWDTETSGQATSAGGTGKTTGEMQDIITFSGATWDIVAVANPSTRNTSYVWNIVDEETYPFLSWQPVS